MTHWHAIDSAAALELLNSDAHQGLAADDVALRQQRLGKNDWLSSNIYILLST
ncbi:MAG: cation-transporting P-type ATPase [Cyanobacteria bacterium J06621_8]